MPSKQDIADVVSVWRMSGKDGDYGFLTFGRDYDPETKKHEEWREEAVRLSDNVENEIAALLVRYPSDKWDTYFSQVTFKDKHRKKEFANHGPFCWLDIDNHNTVDEMRRRGLEPSIWWESSPERLNGVWILDGSVKDLEDQERLNKLLSYNLPSMNLPADRNSWIISKVLRFPGSTHLKNKDNPKQVGSFRRTSLVYSAYSLNVLLNKSEDMHEASTSIVTLASIDSKDSKYRVAVPKIDSNQYSILLRKYRISPDLKKTLTRGNLIGIADRSEAMWAIYHKLIGLGVEQDDICILMRNSIWFKRILENRKDLDAEAFLRYEIDKARIEQEVAQSEFAACGCVVKEDDGDTAFVKFNWDKAYSGEYDIIKWLIDTMLPAVGIVLVYGESNVGKTKLVLNMVGCILSNRNFAPVLWIDGMAVGGKVVDGNGAVVCVMNADDGNPLIAVTNMAVARTFGLDKEYVKDHFITYPNPGGFSLFNPDAVDELCDRLADDRVNVTILDTVAMLAAPAKENTDDMNLVLKNLNNIRVRHKKKISDNRYQLELYNTKNKLDARFEPLSVDYTLENEILPSGKRRLIRYDIATTLEDSEQESVPDEGDMSTTIYNVMAEMCAKAETKFFSPTVIAKAVKANLKGRGKKSPHISTFVKQVGKCLENTDGDIMLRHEAERKGKNGETLYLYRLSPQSINSHGGWLRHEA